MLCAVRLPSSPASSLVDSSRVELSRREQLVEMASGYMRGKVLAAAVRLRLADTLSRPMSVDELAQATSTNTASLERLLRGLEAIGIVRTQDNFVSLTELGDALRHEAEGSASASVVFWADLLADSWTYLDDVVRSGSSDAVAQAMERNGTVSRWSLEPDPLGIFNQVFAELDAAANMRFVDVHDFSTCGVVADLGGGGGGLLEAILLTHPDIRGVLVDRPEAADGARQRLVPTAVGDRCSFITSDLFEGVPIRADAFVMRNVLHIYDDDLAAVILANCASVMGDADRLLIIEPVIPDAIQAGDPDVESIVMSDLNMLVVTGGRERTLGDWKRLVASAGLVVRETTPVPGDGHYSTLEVRLANQ